MNNTIMCPACLGNKFSFNCALCQGTGRIQGHQPGPITTKRQKREKPNYSDKIIKWSITGAILFPIAVIAIAVLISK